MRGSTPDKGNGNLRDMLKELKEAEHRKCGHKRASQIGPREPGQVLVLNPRTVGTLRRVLSRIVTVILNGPV